MQTLIHVYCRSGSSLRERIAKDRRLDRHHLYVVKEHQPGRSPGWLKLRSTEPDRHGAINLEWDSEGVLRCRVVNRGAGRPNSIVGDFLEYVIARYWRCVKTITIVPS
jgi:hypothetical protein